MNTHPYKPGDAIRFAADPQPYQVRAADTRFVIATRPVTPADYEEFPGCEDAQTCLYTIVDFAAGIRGPNFFAFSPYDMMRDVDIQECLADLQSGACEISTRRSIPLDLADPPNA